MMNWDFILDRWCIIISEVVTFEYRFAQTGNVQGKGIVREMTKGSIKTGTRKEQGNFGIEWWRKRVLDYEIIFIKIVLQSILNEYFDYFGAEKKVQEMKKIS